MFLKELHNLDGNIFISPQSLANGLAMVYLMSNGSTAKEISDVLNFPQNISLFVNGYNEVLQFLNVWCFEIIYL